MKIRFVNDVGAEDAQPGDAQWLGSGGEGITRADTGEPVPHRSHSAIAYRCPGCGDERCVPVRPWPSPSWEWDGNVEAPTLTPSILHGDCACKWHGYLTAGEWVTC